MVHLVSVLLGTKMKADILTVYTQIHLALHFRLRCNLTNPLCKLMEVQRSPKKGDYVVGKTNWREDEKDLI